MTDRRRKWGIEAVDDADTLERLVHGVYAEIVRRPTDPAALKKVLIALLSFLASPEGRTNFNCQTVDTFFCIRDDWEADWNHLPTQFQLVLDDMGMCLHDTVSAPDIARNFDSTPEQLLSRVQEIDV